MLNSLKQKYKSDTDLIMLHKLSDLLSSTLQTQIDYFSKEKLTSSEELLSFLSKSLIVIAIKKKNIKQANKTFNELTKLNESIFKTKAKYYEDFKKYEQKILEKQVADSIAYYTLNLKKNNFNYQAKKLEDCLKQSSRFYKTSVSDYNNEAPNKLNKIVRSILQG